MIKRVLLLGANGQLGSDVQIVCNDDSNIQLIPVTRAQLDVEDPNKIPNILDSLGPFDVLLNCTSYHKTDECEDFIEKALVVNGAAVAQMANYCNEHGIVFFHISTDYIFDGKKGKPYVEDDAANPLNAYGVSKLAGENFIKAYCKRHFIFRVSSLFGKSGASGKGGNFVETMLRMAKEGKPLRVVSDQVMSPTHTLDIARAIREVISNDIQDYGVYHCSGEGECSWYEFACHIFELTGVKADVNPIRTSDFITKARRPQYSVLDNSRLHRIYPMPAWEEALTEYLKIKEHI